MGVRPRISIIVGTWNSATTLPRAIESVLAQTMEQLELLVVDDGSTDQTPDLVCAYRDPRLRYLRLEHEGIARSLNRGFHEARSPLVGIQDADDWALPERFERQVALLDERPEVAAVGCQMQEVDELERPLRRRVPVVAGDISRMIMRFNPSPNNCLTLRRDAVLESGGYDPGYFYCTDYDLLLRLHERYSIVNLPDTLGFRTLSQSNYCTGPRNERAQIRECMRVRVGAFRRRRSLKGMAGLAKPTASLLTPVPVKVALRRARNQAP